MKNRILPLLCAVLLCAALLHPLCAYAAEPLDPNAEASLTLYYQKDGKVFPDLQIGIFRVAEAFPDGSFQLLEPFSSYPVHIHDITQQSQWTHITTTLSSYIAANQVQPDREAATDAEGAARFSDLETGLYLVRQVIAENNDGTYIFNAFMVYVPTPQPDGSYAYHVQAKPKCLNYVLKSKYTVIKLWQDDGHQATRPNAVTVEIYRDGVLQQTQVLNEENNWTYSWYVSDDDKGIWTVAEQSVPEHYKVTIQENTGVFTLINARPFDPDMPPQTGDTFSPLPWILAMCFSGILLLILGIYSRRRK